MSKVVELGRHVGWRERLERELWLKYGSVLQMGLEGVGSR